MIGARKNAQVADNFRQLRLGGALLLLMGVDERPYPERLDYQAFDLAEQLDLFTALRRHGARILRLQPPEAWLRVGVHSETGVVSPRNWCSTR